MNWSGNFREGLAREIRENKTLAKITAYTVSKNITCSDFGDLWLASFCQSRAIQFFLWSTSEKKRGEKRIACVKKDKITQWNCNRSFSMPTFKTLHVHVCNDVCMYQYQVCIVCKILFIVHLVELCTHSSVHRQFIAL